ncbi:MAG TPA: hypothetical protein VIW24_26200 [Aldersonia sp.]
MTGRGLRAAAVLAALAGLLLSACGSEVQGTATPAAGGLIDATTGTTPTGTTSPRPTTTTTGSGGAIDFDAEVGECVNLGGTTDDAEIDHADCGSAESNYKIISKEATNADCIGDADSYYYETLNGVEQGALCLDVDWVVGGCMDLSGEDPKRIDCTVPTSDGVKVVEIQQNKTDVNDCPSSVGFVYDVRRFVVCTEDL